MLHSAQRNPAFSQKNLHLLGGGGADKNSSCNEDVFVQWQCCIVFVKRDVYKM